MKRLSVALVCVLGGATAGGFLLSPLLQGQAPNAPAIPKELTSYRDIVKRVLRVNLDHDRHRLAGVKDVSGGVVGAEKLDVGDLDFS